MIDEMKVYPIRNSLRLEALYRILIIFRGEAKTRYQVFKESTEDWITTNNYFKYMLRCGMLKVEYVIVRGEKISTYELSDKGIKFLELLELIYNMLILF